jgi:Arc/MetJ-type ribon-helix-helix transcriptional regulator
MSRIETSRTIQIAVRLRKDQIEALDKAVDFGIFENRTEAIRDAIDMLLILLASSSSGLSRIYRELSTKNQKLTPRVLYKAWFQREEEAKDPSHELFIRYYVYYLDSLILKNAIAFVSRPGEFENFQRTLLHITAKLMKEKLAEIMDNSDLFIEEEGDEKGARPMSRSPSEESER